MSVRIATAKVLSRCLGIVFFGAVLARWGLADIPDAAMMEKINVLQHHRNPVERAQASRFLSATGDRRALRPLIMALGDKSKMVWEYVNFDRFWSSKEIGPLLAEALRSGDRRIVEGVIYKLDVCHYTCKQFPSEIVEPLLPYLHDRNICISLQVFRILRWFRSSDKVRWALVRELFSRKSDAVSLAAQVLGTMRDPRAKPFLIKALGEVNSRLLSWKGRHLYWYHDAWWEAGFDIRQAFENICCDRHFHNPCLQDDGTWSLESKAESCAFSQSRL